MAAPKRRRWAAVAVLSLPAAVSILVACAGGGDRDGRAGQPRAAARPAVTVAYLGPVRRLGGVVTLRARARSRGAAIAAVTFMLDGRPLGSDTTAPYALDLDAGLVPDGRHRLRAVAVDRLGRRGTSPLATLRSRRRADGTLTASPERGLGRALAALRAGNVSVRLAPGRYELRDVRLGTGARLLGSGSRTVIAAAPGADDWALLTVRGRRVRVAGLTLDGAGRVGRGVGVAHGSHDVRLQRLEIRGIRDNGVEIWGAHTGVSIQDSRIDGGGRASAGVFELGSDNSRATSVIRTRIRRFTGFGINFAQRRYGRRAAALHALALDNHITDISDPRVATGTHEGGIWSGGVAAAIIGNAIRRVGTDGIQTVGSSTGVTVIGNDIADAPVGIYLEHATNRSLFERNVLTDVGTGINVEWRYGGAGSSRNTFRANRMVSAREAAVFVDVGADDNRILANDFVGGVRPAVILQGSSNNLVRGNRACGAAAGPLIREQSGRRQDGGLAHPRGNRLAGNRAVAECPRR